VTALRGILAIWCVLWGVIVLQMFTISRMQKQKQNDRIAAGLPAILEDFSMSKDFHEAGAEIHGENGLADMTDKQNIYFQYLL
jgi:hypothetical protein